VGHKGAVPTIARPMVGTVLRCAVGKVMHVDRARSPSKTGV